MSNIISIKPKVKKSFKVVFVCNGCSNNSFHISNDCCVICAGCKKTINTRKFKVINLDS